ncbi:MAG: HAD family hydrolase [Janthinobacterium lividum]
MERHAIFWGMTLDVSRIEAISLDLDDTLWPVWPTIERAEVALHDWLLHAAPRTADLLATPGILRELREATARERSDLAHDLSGLRRESIRTALRRSGEDPALAEAAFEVFFMARQQVVLYDDALPALRLLSARYPLVAISNGNADLRRTGVDRWFRTGFSAYAFGVAKPDRAIFEAAAASVGVAPDAMLHVGDDATLDVVGARYAGMQAIWLARDNADAELPDWPVGGHPQATVATLTALCELLKIPAQG